MSQNTPPFSGDDGRPPDQPQPASGKLVGRIKHVTADKGFGFIQSENQADVFFHFSTFDSSGRLGSEVKPEVGLWVEYELDEDVLLREKKLRTKKVRLTDEPLDHGLGPLPTGSSATDKNKRAAEDEDQPRNQVRFPIQRKHLGTIKAVMTEKDFGFIESENFRDDVFFHFTTFETTIPANSDQPGGKPEVGLWVEFELDEEVFREQQKLRTKIVRPTDRPRGRKLSGRDATFNIVTHHPRARKKRPSWRNKE